MLNILCSIEEGKLAELLVLDRNLLDVTHNTTSIRYVLKNGLLYDANHQPLSSSW